ncbi:hypothetical protein F2Q69_00006298 [Brassica cretica]|uniref:Uncharacterized protein n=1 Tax=Brassica cretica TaxID=69181 RepID=A0A8S9P1B3_BRACR|nr:hypothetical protein F2Q69_00006298 [Brassica cretica]
MQSHHRVHLVETKPEPQTTLQSEPRHAHTPLRKFRHLLVSSTRRCPPSVSHHRLLTAGDSVDSVSQFGDSVNHMA